MVEPTRLKLLGGAGIRDIHNVDVANFFPNGEGIHVRVIRLLDI